MLSLPLTGYLLANNSIYQATRAAVLSDANPYWFKGTAGQGVGGPHVGLGWIWPLSIITRGLTSTDAKEVCDKGMSAVE